VKASLAALTKVVPKSQSEELATMRKVWLADLLMRNEQRLAGVTAERRAQAARLSPARNYPTTMQDDVFVSPTPLAPRPVTTAILAGLVIFAAGLVYALIREGARKPRKAPETAGDITALRPS